MSIFQPTVTRNGEKTKAKTWSIKYRNAKGERVQENGFKTRTEAAIRERDAIREVREERAGIRTPKIKQNEKPLAEHLSDFQQSLEAKEVSPDQVKLVQGRLKRAFDASGMNLLSDLNANDFQKYLAAIRKKGKSQQTCKHIVRHAKQFVRFLIDDDRIAVDPFRKLRPQKVSERRHRRRALTSDECTRLLKAVRICGVMYDLSGADQEALFLTALHTGYRASELSRLVVANMNLEGEHPHVSLAGKDTKNRDEARIPLRDPQVVTFLKTWIAGKARDAVLWPGKWATSRGGSKLMRQALKAAGIDYEVDGRKADFHALRYTFITNLIKAGWHPAYVQRLARHSDINLTFRVYTDLGLEDLYHGMLQQGEQSPSSRNGNPRDRTPKAESGPTESPDADGEAAKSVAPNVAPQVVPECLPASQDVTVATPAEGKKSRGNGRKRTPKAQGATGDNSTCRPVSQNVEAERQGFEPWMDLHPCRFSRPVQSAALPPLQVLFTTAVTVNYGDSQRVLAGPRIQKCHILRKGHG